MSDKSENLTGYDVTYDLDIRGVVSLLERVETRRTHVGVIRHTSEPSPWEAQFRDDEPRAFDSVDEAQSYLMQSYEAALYRVGACTST